MRSKRSGSGKAGRRVWWRRSRPVAPEGTDPRARSAPLGGNAVQSRQCALEARRTREGDREARGGGRGLSRGAEGTYPRARSTGRRRRAISVLSTLGERESGTARLEEEVAACRTALKERTCERVPRHWAATQNNLGNALGKLGERSSGTARLEEAVAAYRAALEQWTRERAPYWHDIAKQNLARYLAFLGQRRKQ
jgi:tetratricopeptide (TPR) repeat protein